MSGYDEPDWIRGTTEAPAPATQDANTGAAITAAPDAAAPATNESSSSGVGKARLALMGLSVLGLGLAAMMGALGVLTIIEVHSAGVGQLSEPFLAAYMVLFALLLFMYELMWWAPMPAVNKSLRKNFGFLYGLRGKGLYLIFVACLCLGLGNDASVKALNYATGVAFLGGGCLHWFVICFHPDLAGQYTAPTAGIGGTSESTEEAGANVV